MEIVFLVKVNEKLAFTLKGKKDKDD